MGASSPPPAAVLPARKPSRAGGVARSRPLCLAMRTDAKERLRVPLVGFHNGARNRENKAAAHHRHTGQRTALKLEEPTGHAYQRATAQTKESPAAHESECVDEGGGGGGVRVHTT